MRVGAKVRTVCTVYVMRHKNQVQTGSMLALPAGALGVVKAWHPQGVVPFLLVCFERREGRYWGRLARSVLEILGDDDDMPTQPYASLSAQIAREIDALIVADLLAMIGKLDDD